MAKKPKHNFTCKFCNKGYQRESTLLSHKCVKRDRYNERESRPMREAYRMYLMFMEFQNLQMKKSVDPIMQFIQSSNFNIFYDFAVYILGNDILNKEEFIKHILTSGLPAYLWCTEKTHTEWVIKNIKNEHPRRGLERSINAMVEWGVSTEQSWTDFFKLCSTERALLWFESGKLSPWIIYVPAPEVGNELLVRFSPSELEYLSKFLEPNYFMMKQAHYLNEIKELRGLLKEAGL